MTTDDKTTTEEEEEAPPRLADREREREAARAGAGGGEGGGGRCTTREGHQQQQCGGQSSTGRSDRPTDRPASSPTQLALSVNRGREEPEKERQGDHGWALASPSSLDRTACLLMVTGCCCCYPFRWSAPTVLWAPTCGCCCRRTPLTSLDATALHPPPTHPMTVRQAGRASEP